MSNHIHKFKGQLKISAVYRLVLVLNFCLKIQMCSEGLPNINIRYNVTFIFKLSRDAFEEDVSTNYVPLPPEHIY